MIPLTAAQTRDALSWVGWPYKNRGSCACEFLSFPANLGGYNLTPGNPVSTWGCLTFLLALSLQTKRFLGLILAPLFRSGKLYGVPVDAALRLRFGHYRDNYNFQLTFDILLHVLPTHNPRHHLHSTDDIQKRASADEDPWASSC